MIKKIKSTIKLITKTYKESHSKNTYIPVYKVVELIEKEKGEYIATIQIINKNVIFHEKPENILKDDALVDQFSPRDIRTLTYLGYLSINTPKYTILAKRLSENTDKTVFALKERGKRKVIAKSAHEIFSNKDVLKNLSPGDAHDIGYTIAAEAVLNEKKQKQLLREQLENATNTQK